MLKSFRPAGNKIHLKATPFNTNRFSPLNINFHQSGTASLASAIIASCSLKNKPIEKGEILLPAYACPDLIASILYAGATPILIDLQENSSFLSLDDLENKITKNSIAIISVNFLGIADQIESIKRVCEIHQLYLINDSAQWFPKISNIDNWPGDFNIISFGRGKPVSLLHGGAVITTHDETLRALEKVDLSPGDEKKNFIETVKILIYNLVIQPFFYGVLTHIPGLNIGETKFTKLTTITRMTGFYLNLLEKNIEKYKPSKTNHELIHQKLQKISNYNVIDLFPAGKNAEDIALLRYPLLITDKAIRDKFFDETSNLGVSTLYKRPLNEIKGLDSILNSQAIYPNASNFADHLVTLPTHEDVQEFVINKIFEKLEMVLSE